jgi:chaperonin GroEL
MPKITITIEPSTCILAANCVGMEPKLFQIGSEPYVELIDTHGTVVGTEYTFEATVAELRAGKVLITLKAEGDEQIGIDIIRKATEEPLRQISGNAGYEGAIVIEKVRSNESPNYGFNAATGVYEDLVASGVIDPTKVTRSALQHAASISALMLTTEAMICEIPEKKSNAGPPAGHGPDMDY